MKTVGTASQLKLTNILYATDLSFAAERALPYALAIANRHGSTVYAVHVIEPDHHVLVPGSLSPKAAEEEIFRRENKEELEEQLKMLPHQVIFEAGEPWPTLSKLIDEKHIDLIVFSTHGRAGLEKRFFGSIAELLLRRSPCPVLAVGPAVSVKPREDAKLNRIVYATDFGAESLAAAPYAISLAQEHHAQLILVHSIEHGGDVPALLDTLRQLVPYGAGLKSEPECMVDHGVPARKILETAEAHGADLIVLGVHEKKGIIQEHLTRSGVFRIVTRAKCPVLIVHS